MGNDTRKPYTTKRINRGPGRTMYEVFDAATGDRVGDAFLYLGDWWVNNAGSFRNRRYSKDDAIAGVWASHIAAVEPGEEAP